MFKNRKVMKEIILAVLLLCTAYLVYSIIANPLGDCMTFCTSRISSSAVVVSGALSLSYSCALRILWKMGSHQMEDKASC